MNADLHFSAREIADLHDRSNRLWHQNPAASDSSEPTASSEGGPSFILTVLAQHRANFDLWHTEDRARAPRATDHDLAQVKHAIDQINQRRNDLTELCDTLLLDALGSAGLPNDSAELHSESPGLMIDRLSILSLKIWHTQEEIGRPDAPAGHAERNRQRLALLTEQRDDLALCLDRLWSQVLAGARRFKLYRQLKMYNDPALNPEMYGSPDR